MMGTLFVLKMYNVGSQDVDQHAIILFRGAELVMPPPLSQSRIKQNYRSINYI